MEDATLQSQEGEEELEGESFEEAEEEGQDFQEQGECKMEDATLQCEEEEEQRPVFEEAEHENLNS